MLYFVFISVPVVTLFFFFFKITRLLRLQVFDGDDDDGDYVLCFFALKQVPGCPLFAALHYEDLIYSQLMNQSTRSFT